ncbi:MAG TPA: GNAT family N-acetyltransferase [Longimicrobium sp.]|jgi:GNAT superfamily N-acetyltransferase|uniref:GNAT family N-acetyltransferase n=1 Tax=Longimicrobium sp. TaxID=2029185 RepID=UPI002ED9AC3B
MEYRNAVQADVPLLAEINRQLIEDEWEGTSMSIQRLEQRMSRWLEDGDYRAILFLENGATVAYSLVSVDEDDSAFIRHFFVLREHRGAGVGRRAMQTLLRDIIPPTARVTLDVLASNAGGHQFWKSVGFRDYAIRMERVPSADAAAESGSGDAGPAA